MFDAQPPHSSADAFIARARGDQQKAQAIYSAIREKMNAKWAGLPQRDIEIAKAAKIDAGLGRKEEAISEARRAVELRPIAQDSLFGPDLVRTSRLSTRGPVNPPWRLSNWKSSQKFQLARATANFASIRRGMLCAAIRASKKSSPRSRRTRRTNKPTRSRQQSRRRAAAANCFARLLRVRGHGT